MSYNQQQLEADGGSIAILLEVIILVCKICPGQNRVASTVVEIFNVCYQYYTL